MDQYLLFAIIGLGSGCLYAALSMGLVITYRGTGIINFATGAMAMWGAYVYDELSDTGDLVLPLVIIRSRISLGGSSGSVPFGVAIILAVLSCSLIGLMVHFLVFRPLRRAPILARVVASVGVLLVIQALIVMHFMSSARVVAPILPNEPVSFAGVSFSRDRLWLTAVVLLTAAAAWAWFRFTRLGLATRASTENERAVSLARYSPQVLAGSTWVLSSTLVGFLLIMASPVVSLSPWTYLAIVPALAAAVIGRLLSIAVTVAAAFGLGIFQSIVVYQTTNPWWPDWAITGIPDALPFGVIVIALFGLGHNLPTRGAVEADALPEVVRPKMRPSVVASAVVAAGVLTAVAQGSYRIGIMTSMIMTIVMLSLVVLTGLVGQISLAQAAIAGAAGFALSKLGDSVGIPFPISLLLAALMATAFGLVVGVSALRIRGAQLAVVTLAGAGRARGVRVSQLRHHRPVRQSHYRSFVLRGEPQHSRGQELRPYGIRIPGAGRGDRVRHCRGQPGPKCDRAPFPGRSFQRAGGRVGRHQCRGHEDAGIRAGVVPGRCGRCVHRLQPGTALGGELRRAHRPELPGAGLPVRHHERSRRDHRGAVRPARHRLHHRRPDRRTGPVGTNWWLVSPWWPLRSSSPKVWPARTARISHACEHSGHAGGPGQRRANAAISERCPPSPAAGTAKASRSACRSIGARSARGASRAHRSC